MEFFGPFLPPAQTTPTRRSIGSRLCWPWPLRGPCTGMKVFVIYDAPEVTESLHHKLAITLPAKWLDQSVEKVRDAFVGAYNKKFPDNALVASELVLSVKETSPFAQRSAACQCLPWNAHSPLTTFLLLTVPSRFCPQPTHRRARLRTAVRFACARSPPPADRAAAEAHFAARTTVARPSSMRRATTRRAAATTRCLLSSMTCANGGAAVRTRSSPPLRSCSSCQAAPSASTPPRRPPRSWSGKPAWRVRPKRRAAPPTASHRRPRPPSARPPPAGRASPLRAFP